MKKIVPFKKEITFKTELSEITSIALEHNYKLEDNKILGEFIINGDYKINLDSENREPFINNIPFQINLDEKYILDNISVDIDDFYYEIINNNVLSVNIEVLIDKLEEKEIIEEEKEEVEQERCVEEEITLFSETKDIKDTYASYKVYIVRENDLIEEIMGRYNVTKEELEKYNDLKELKIGDKLIIPFMFDEETK